MPQEYNTFLEGGESNEEKTNGMAAGIQPVSRAAAVSEPAACGGLCGGYGIENISN